MNNLNLWNPLNWGEIMIEEMCIRDRVIILILWWRNFQLEYWRTFQLVSTGLQSFTQKRYSNYTVLYIAYHGRKNRICIGNEYITLKEIADVLEDKLNGIIVHFGSCSTLNTTEKNITDFIKRTGCALISGYKKDVPYIDSSAFELLYFNVLNTYKTYTSIKKNIVGKYPTLVDILRFTFLY